MMQETGGATLVQDEYTDVLRAFSLSVLDIGYNVSKNCSQLGMEDGPQYSWSLVGSIMFAMTITTTIGMVVYR